MSIVPPDLKYTAEHEWIRMEPDGTLTVGITDHAQQAFGDIVFLELPGVGASVDAGQPVGIVESVKAASEIFAPASGAVVEVNAEIVETPELVNADAYAHWLFKLAPSSVPDGKLIDAAAYSALIE